MCDIFYQKGKCLDNYVSKEHARVRLKEKQDIAEVRPHKKFLVSRPLKIEKAMRACDFYSYFLSFLQGQIKISETGVILQFSDIMRNVFLS